MPSLPEPLLRALAAGATVVTPNRRLARRLIALYDQTERNAGRTVWPAARALPWDAFVPTLWQDAVASGAAPDDLRLRSPLQAAHAWRRIVAAHAGPLVDQEGAAALAVDAWATVHAWGEGGESWRGWAGGDDVDDDCAAFVRWATGYARDLTADGAVDPAQLPDRLCGWVGQLPPLRGASIVLAGFAELTPQQERLRRVLSAAGAEVACMDTLTAERGRVARAAGTAPDDEIARALAWARARALADPTASIGIAVADLASRREEIRARAEDLLCPALQWPGSETAPRPYNLSLGGALGNVPLVAVALELLAWAGGALPPDRAAAVLRSAYVGTPDAWLRRAQLETTWLEQGRRAITMHAAHAALRTCDRALAERWEAALDRHALPAHAAPREHADAWRAWLAAVSWPGARALDSAEHQAQRAWDEALAGFATLGAVHARMSRTEAQAALRAQLAAHVFQPEAPAAPIQIIGLLEAAGQPFDALWVAGLAAERWPPPPQPHPLLPVPWQRLRNVPRASAARELDYATMLTAQFARAAREVVFSHPETIDDHGCSVSPLVPAASAPADESPRDRGTAFAQFARNAPREFVVDDFAPPLALPVRAKGGARLVEAQSDCPFKAVAAYRLAAEAWPEPIDGLSAQERGTLVHAALAAFWGSVGTQRTLTLMTPDALRIAVMAAAEAAKAALPAARWRALLPAVAAGEAERIAAVVADWIEIHERRRPPFAVIGIEKGLSLALHGIVVTLRLDRVDALDGGGVAIVDYKTGRAKGPDTWFEPRPQAPQLGLYALAHRAAAPGQPVRAVAYAQLKPGEIAARGIAADAGAWPGLPLPTTVRHAALADWGAALSRWADSLDALGAEIVAGLATVTPRDPRSTCTHCGLQPLCRIRALASHVGERDDDAID